MSDVNRANLVVWVDIPVKDLDRAVKFYAETLGTELEVQSYEGHTFAVFKHDNGNGGCLTNDGSETTASSGPLVYLGVEGRLRDAVGKAEAWGGRVTTAPHSMGPHGWRAVVVDSEGNRIALHSSVDG